MKKGKKARWPNSQSSYSSDHDDTIGHHRGRPGSYVAGRYRIEKDVGMGTFGRVVQCFDTRGGRSRDRIGPVAIKIVRSIKRYYDSAVIEADICEGVNRRSGQGLSHFAIMHDRFDLPTGHYCLVFECLGMSLYDFLKAHHYLPFPLYCVQDFARQLLEAIAFLHSFKLIHTDLKPENVLLTSNATELYRNWDGSSQTVPRSTSIKVIDFGGATYDHEKKSSVVNTRQYRAPEVILGLSWSMPSDLWSAGCVIAECYLGNLFFATHDNAEHLALIERAVGPFPPDMVSNAKTNGEYFDSQGMHRGKSVLSSRSKDHVRQMRPLEAVVAARDRDCGLYELLRELLTIDPKARMKGADALNRCSFVKTHSKT